MPESPDLDLLIADLADRGFASVPGLLRRDQLEALEAEAREGWQSGEFHRAGIGRGAEERPEIRGDHVAWLDPENLSPAQRAYWDFVDAFRRECNRQLYAGLADFEAHFAIYPPGAFYRRHRDRFQSEGRRTLSCLLYLNQDWLPEHGGALRLYPRDEDGQEVQLDIRPEAGMFVVFRSDSLEHEVLVAHRERISLTGWLRRAG
jgi:SM-20-related protein